MSFSRLARPEAASEFERWMTCNGCGEEILVCGAVSDLIPGVYRGVWCKCRKPLEPWPESSFSKPRGVEA